MRGDRGRWTLLRRLPLPAGTLLLAGNAARITAKSGEQPPSWAGLATPAAPGADHVLAVGLAVLGVLLVVLGWLFAVHDASTRRLSRGGVWALFGVSVLPLVAGPPLFSHDPFSYAAQGLLAAHGDNPYRWAPTALGHGPFLAAVDPVWRGVVAPYGPLGLAADWFAAAVGGGLIGTVVVIRLVALAAVVVALHHGPADLLGQRQPLWLPMLALNPITLLFLISSGHNDALVGCLVVIAISCARRGQLGLAGLSLALASAVKWPAILALPAVVAIGPQTLRDAANRCGRALAAVAGLWLALWLVVPDAFGWVRAAGVPAQSVPSWTPATLLGHVAATLTDSSFAGSLHAVRLVAIAATAGFAAWALTGRRRGTVAAAGWTLVAVALAAPSVYPWYLAWGLFALPASSWWRHDWLVPLSVIVSITPMTVLPTAAVVAIDVAVVAGWAVGRLRRRRAVPAPTVRGPWTLAAPEAAAAAVAP